MKRAISFVTSFSLFVSISAAPTPRILVKFDDGEFNENLSRKSEFDSTRTKISGILHEDLSTFCCWLGQTLSCNSQYFCIVDSHMWLSSMHYAFSWQQPLRERAAILFNVYISYLVVACLAV